MCLGSYREVTGKFKVCGLGMLLVGLLALAVACENKEVYQRSLLSTLSPPSAPLESSENLKVGSSGVYSGFHRSPTWQDTSNLTPDVDYRADEITLIFGGVSEDSFHYSGVGDDFNRSSVLYQDVKQAHFARYLAVKYGLTLISGAEAHVEGLSFASYKVPTGKDAKEVMQEILDLEPQVKIAEFRPIRKFDYVPNDPYLNMQWHHAMIDSYGAWDIETGSEGVWIAVLDSGVEIDHPDLVNNVLAVNDLWPSEDFDMGESDSTPLDMSGHGTHIAGIICAMGDNAVGVAGIAYNLKVMPIKISDDGGQILGDVPTAIILAAELGARVVNMSFGNYMVSRAESEAVRYAHDKGVLVVASAGNDGTDSALYFPASNPEVISVGALNKLNLRTFYSNFGISVDIAAPGGEAFGPDVENMIYSTYLNGGYRFKQGTSMSAPMVSAVAGLVMSRFGDDYSVDEYRGWIERAGQLGDYISWKNPFLRLLDARKSLNPSGSRAPTATILEPSGDLPVSGEFRVEFAYEGQTPILNKLLYLDGVLQPSMEIDTTEFFPGSHLLVLEVMDQNYQRAFARKEIVVEDVRSFTAPYSTDFDTEESLVGWTSQDFSGNAVWHVRDLPTGSSGYTLGEPSGVTPFFTSVDVDWLLSPNIDLRGYERALLRFYGNWYLEPGINVRIRLIGEQGDVARPFVPAAFDGYYTLNIDSLTGGCLKVMYQVSGGNRATWNTIRIDNFGIYVPTPPPEVSIEFPFEEARLRGFTDVSVNARDPSQDLEYVEIVLDGDLLDRIYTPPFEIKGVDTTGFPNGRTTLTAIAYDNDYIDDDGDGRPQDKATASRIVYVQNHVVNAVTPSNVSWGDEIRIFGSNFSNHRENAKLEVGFFGRMGTIHVPIDQVISWNESLIRVYVPYGAVSGRVTVRIDDGLASSIENLMVFDPLQGFRVLSPKADEVFAGDFYVTLPPLPLVDKLNVAVPEVPGINLDIPTKDNQNEVRVIIPGSTLRNGRYTLMVTAYYEEYSESVVVPFFISTLPGDFNADGRVDSNDVHYLYMFLRDHNGRVEEGNPDFMPFMDANGDGIIDERDASLVGYRFGNSG